MRQFWKTEVMFVADEIPDDAVPFGIGAKCPSCDTPNPRPMVVQISHAPARFKCSLGIEHDAPPKIIEVHGDMLVVRDNATNVILSTHAGTFCKETP